MTNSGNVSNFYDTDSEIYDLRWEKAGGEATTKSQMAIVSSLTRLWENKEILEVGCGSGRFSEHIAKISSYVIYLDLTQGMLRVTRRKINRQSKPFVGLNASAYDIPLASGSRDAVISINVFNHIQTPEKALREIYRVLKPGGHLLINFTNLYSYYFPMAMIINSSHRSIGRDVYSVWSKPKEVMGLLKNIGFSIDKVVGNVFVPLNLDKPVIREIPIALDRISKNSTLKWLAPTLFFYCKKH